MGLYVIFKIRVVALPTPLTEEQQRKTLQEMFELKPLAFPAGLLLALQL